MRGELYKNIFLWIFHLFEYFIPYTSLRSDSANSYIISFKENASNITYACGTGTGSVVTVLSEKGLVSGDHTAVEMPGGILYVDVIREDGKVKDLYLSGPAHPLYLP